MECTLWENVKINATCQIAITKKRYRPIFSHTAAILYRSYGQVIQVLGTYR